MPKVQEPLQCFPLAGEADRGGAAPLRKREWQCLERELVSAMMEFIRTISLMLILLFLLAISFHLRNIDCKFNDHPACEYKWI
jgi:hypothetical protein